eukprot:PhM_4_TR11661/c2_g1_i14/m.64094
MQKDEVAFSTRQKCVNRRGRRVRKGGASWAQTIVKTTRYQKALQLFLRPVADRSAGSLNPDIEHLAAGSWTQITTDCWRTNIALRSRFRLVNHRHYFVDPQT